MEKGNIFTKYVDGNFIDYIWGVDLWKTPKDDKIENTHRPSLDVLTDGGFMIAILPSSFDTATHRKTGEKILNGEVIEWEITQKTPEELADIALAGWKIEMSVLDSQVTPRMTEDIFDFITGETTELPSQIGALMSARKSKRAEKP